MERFKYDIKYIEREMDRIGSPKRYRFPLREIFDHDNAIILSMLRQQSRLP